MTETQLPQPPSADDECLQEVLASSRQHLEAVGATDHASTWLGSALGSRGGTASLYARLEALFAQPACLQWLRAPQRKAQADAAAERKLQGLELRPAVLPEAGNGRPAAHGQVQVAGEAWWTVEQPAEAEGACLLSMIGVVRGDARMREPRQVNSELAGAEPLDSWQMVDKQDALEAMGVFVAAYLASLPEAQHMEPQELQKALVSTFKALQQGRVRRLWEWGRFLYRYAALGYGAFSVYENPWMVRAALAAVWTAARIMIGLL